MKLFEVPMPDRPDSNDIKRLISGAIHLTYLASEYRKAGLDMYRESSPLFDADIREEEIPRGRKFTKKLLESEFGVKEPDLETALKNPTDPFGEAAAMQAASEPDMTIYSHLIYDGFYPDDDDDDPDGDIIDTMKYI